MQFYSNQRSTLILPPIQIKSFFAQRHPFYILEADPFPISTGLFLLTLLTPRNVPLHEVPTRSTLRRGNLHRPLLRSSPNGCETLHSRSPSISSGGSTCSVARIPSFRSCPQPFAQFHPPLKRRRRRWPLKPTPRAPYDE
jgi:hypothetical protein